MADPTPVSKTQPAIALNDLLTLVRWLRTRPRMFLDAERYELLAAFLEGYDTGSPSHELEGFQPWLSERVYGQPSPIRWVWLVVKQATPARDPESQFPLSDLTAQEDADSFRLALDQIEEYLLTQSSPTPPHGDAL